MNIYVGNLSAQMTDDELGREFMTFGAVTSVTILKGSRVGGFGGHGFVEMLVSSEGEAAIAAMNKTILNGRKINVIQALPLSHKAGPALYAGSYGDKPLNRFGASAKGNIIDGR